MTKVCLFLSFKTEDENSNIQEMVNRRALPNIGFVVNQPGEILESPSVALHKTG